MTLLSELQTSILLARRARYISTSFWLVAAVFILAIMAAQFSGRQPATVALDVGLSAIRLLLPVMIVMLVQELLSREFDRRYFLTSLTYPRPRHKLLIGRIAATLLLVYLVLFLMALLLLWMTSRITLGYEQGTPPDLGMNYWITIVFIAVDLFVVTAMASFLALVASTPSFVLIGTFGFMLVSRSFANIIALLEHNRYVLEDTESYKHSLEILGYLLPDLAALDIRMASLYANTTLIPADWLASLTACLTYAIFLLAVAHLYLQRKQFN